ncbi:hypothetical protein ACFQFH_20000 [Halobaculum halobium]|uniref:Uncharacterized protein n=1 Tax=Halobaculum halobium TaxID=3032281 RepID=A0ABD5T7F5_9EURY|nr:hypothetical protein [Halobaculum sp. SYNS20]
MTDDHNAGGSQLALDDHYCPSHESLRAAITPSETGKCLRLESPHGTLSWVLQSANGNMWRVAEFNNQWKKTSIGFAINRVNSNGRWNWSYVPLSDIEVEPWAI